MSAQDEIYVLPSLERLKVQGREGEDSAPIWEPVGGLSDERVQVVLGDAGAGKSTWLHHNRSDRIHQAIRGRVPDSSLVFLDGLDEGDAQVLKTHLDAWFDNHGSSGRLLVTCRTATWTSSFWQEAVFADVGVYRLVPFDDKQVEELAGKLGGRCRPAQGSGQPP